MQNSTRPMIDATWLIRLRWISAVSQLALILVVSLVFAVQLPLAELCVVLGLLLVTNAGLAMSTRVRAAPSTLEVGSVLILDTLLLYATLFLTGGPSNPFSIVFLVHIALAAVVLGARWTWLLAGVASVCFAALFFWHRPLPGVSHDMHDSFSFHLYGMFIAFLLTALLVAFFVSRVASQLQETEQQLRESEGERQKQLRLSSLATLAAGAAHELATPLSTIAIAAGELAEELRNTPLLHDDVELIRKQVKRCKEVLDQMGASGGQLKGELSTAISSRSVVTGVLDELPPKRQALVDCEIKTPAELYLPSVGLRQSLLALVRNALDASDQKGKIRVTVSETFDGVLFEVRDWGCGMSTEVRERVGEPFFTTKEPGAGMGLGLFLTKAFVAQNGGSLEFESASGEGTVARMWFPKQRRIVGA